MKLSKVKILGKDYKITYVPKMENVNTESSELLFGQIRYVDNDIRIFGGLKEFDRFQVLLHEVVHGISTSLALGLDERQIDLVALGMANVLIDNKMIKDKNGKSGATSAALRGCLPSGYDVAKDRILYPRRGYPLVGREVTLTAQFEKDIKRAKKRSYDMGKLSEVIRLLGQGDLEDRQYRDHPLKGKYEGLRECHLSPAEAWSRRPAPHFGVKSRGNPYVY
jgi:addiction module RelE/StbE family toxin